VTVNVGVRTEHTGDVLHVVLDRPEKGNALRHADMTAVLEAVATAVGTVRAILIRSDGRHFCTGADLTAPDRTERPPIGHQMRGLHDTAHRLIQVLWDCPLPTVAAVHGRAAGLGLHLALATDFVVAATTATFSEPFAERGFTPDSGATYLLPRLIGISRAKTMLLRGEVIDAPTALDWGMISETVPEDRLAGAAARLAADLAAGPTFSLGLAKAMIHGHTTATLSEALSDEAVNVELSIRSADFKEGIRAFRAKRPPDFTGA
jgi:2-(1,2-epoxy-1,2-dihydrophenyl)acetyl-CoA isomerase